ncbi:uncharacterized protein [Panulirus ornatus]|uniref:uncharacterized protein isoform X1 n=1 Tax=Panulirus ornatus TaxID=150431 RepID=UPI003A89AEB1
MSSSCVPPKGCVVHNPDPYSQDPDPHRHDDCDDSGSECGSLCTCTSSSMTSLATSMGSREAIALGRNSASSMYLAAPPAAPPAGTQVATQTADSSGSPYFVVFVSPQMSGREGNGCGNCQQRQTVQAALKSSLRTACDFCPWIAGFVIIYYSFYWWGLGPGFSAFLCVVGAHAIVRFFKARGVLHCSANNLSEAQQESDPSQEEEGDEEDSEGVEQRARQQAIENLANEKPPSYEAAVVKPPPYDLHFHLTPTQPRSQTVAHDPEKQFLNKMEFLTVPNLVVDGTAEDSCDEKDDVFLPSYQDAIRLSFRSDKDPTENQEQD